MAKTFHSFTCQNPACRKSFSRLQRVRRFCSQVCYWATDKTPELRAKLSAAVTAAHKRKPHWKGTGY